MNSATRYVVVDQNGSPYSIKLRAVMRYRRLLFDWVMLDTFTLYHTDR